MAATFCWGTSASLSKFSLTAFGPMTLLTVDLAIATAALWTVLLLRHRSRPQPVVADRGRLAVLGLLQPCLTYVGMIWGLAYTSASNAAVLADTESFFVVLLAAVFLRERLTARVLLCLGLTVTGVWLLEGGLGGGLHLGDALVVAGALAAAGYAIVAKAFPPRVDTLTMTAYQFLFGLLCLAPLTIALWVSGREQLPGPADPAAWGTAVAAGLLGYAVSFLLFNYGLAAIPAGEAGMLLNLIPVFGVAVAMVSLGERLTPWEVTGAVTVVGSVLLFPRTRSDLLEVEVADKAVPGLGDREQDASDDRVCGQR
ncbi:DMT family transporter [Micromonospora sp. KC606]|uniref:DMT family transporter n=1 Tax=Micromonospora sp. KC606 TaxID=2530379 RepID=UPI001404A0C9|nr:DMT family transporter [Micromonospora sp. KC606]